MSWLILCFAGWVEEAWGQREKKQMGGNTLPDDGETPRVLCFSHSETMQWGYFYVPLHGREKEKDSGGDGEGRGPLEERQERG